MQEWLLQMGQNAGPVVALIIYSFYSLSKKVDTVEANVKAKLENGIRTEINNLQKGVSDCRVAIANISGRCTNCPSNLKGGEDGN